MKKSKYRKIKVLSLILSVVMIICSIPMSVIAETVEPTESESILQSEWDDFIVAESYEMIDPTLDWQGLPIKSSQNSIFESSASLLVEEMHIKNKMKHYDLLTRIAVIETTANTRVWLESGVTRLLLIVAKV